MSNPLNQFDWLAKYYDLLSRLISRNRLHHSQVYFLDQIPDSTAILILGGGTGGILKQLLMANRSCLVWYVEASGQMISIARKKVPVEVLSRVKFIHGTERSLSGQSTFDIIITNFFIDMFPGDVVQSICRSLYPKLNHAGCWFVSDFVDNGKWWQKFLLWMMYRFFRLTCKIEASELPAWERHLKSTGLEALKSRLFYGGFIKSVVYKKKG